MFPVRVHGPLVRVLAARPGDRATSALTLRVEAEDERSATAGGDANGQLALPTLLCQPLGQKCAIKVACQTPYTRINAEDGDGGRYVTKKVVFEISQQWKEPPYWSRCLYCIGSNATPS